MKQQKLQKEIDKRAYQNIMNLFGGEEKFIKLPEIPSQRCEEIFPDVWKSYDLHGVTRPDHVCEVLLQDLTAPIMRGADSIGRPFLL